MDKDILLDGKTLISAKRASEKFGYSQDYIGQLARNGQVDAKLIGRTWFVDADGLRGHKQSKSSRKKDQVEMREEPEAPQALDTEKKYEAVAQPLMPELKKRPVPSRWSLRNKVIAEAVLGFSMLAIVSASGIYGLKSFSPELAENVLAKLASVGAAEQALVAEALESLPHARASNSALSLASARDFFTRLASVFRNEEMDVATQPESAGEKESVASAEPLPQIVREVETVRETRVVERGTAYYEDPALRAEVEDMKNLFASRSFLNLQTNAIYDSMSQSIESIDHLDSLSLSTTLDVLGLTTLADLAFENALGISATTTNFYAGNAAFSNLIATGQTLTDLLFTNATGTNATTTNLYSSSLMADNATTTNFFSTNGSIASLFATSATTTNFFSTTASSTNLYASLLTVGGSALAVDASGNVGIGTTSPMSKLSIAGTDVFARISGSTRAGLLLQPTTGGSAFKGWQIETSAATDNAPGGYLTIVEVGAIPRLTIASSTGNIGIGTTNPGYKLDIAGPSVAAGAGNSDVLRLRNPSDGGVNIIFSNNVTNTLANIIASTTSTGAGTDDGVLAFSTAADGMAAERMRITSAGNVGIGTTTPADKLVVGSAEAGGNLRLYSSSYGNNGLARFYGTDGTERMQIGSGGATNAFIYTPASVDLSLHAGNSERVTIKSGGNVGIGITNPGAKLDVREDATTLAVDVRNTNSSGFGMSVIGGSGSNYALAVNDYQGNNIMRVLGNGNVGIGLTNPSNLLSLGASGGPTMRFTDTSSSAFSIFNSDSVGSLLFSADHGNTGASTVIKFNIDTNEFMRIQANGNIGIGTTTPTKLMDVNGSLRARSSFQVDRSTGDSATYFGVIQRDAASSGNFGNAIGNGQSEVFTFGTAGMMIGTIDSVPVAIGTANTERMRVTSTGNVGIGTTDPKTTFFVDTGSDRNFFVGNDGTRVQFGGLNDSGGSYSPTAIDGSSLILNYNSGGNVGIGITNPDTKLYVNGGFRVAGAMRVDDGTGSGIGVINLGNADTRIRSTASITSLWETWNGSSGYSTAFSFNGQTNTFAIPSVANCNPIKADSSGVLNCSSDERLKDISEEYVTGLSAIKAINPIIYSWRADSGLHNTSPILGFSAQNVEAVIPEAVTFDSKGYRQLNEFSILAAAVNAIKELDMNLASTTISLDFITMALNDQSLKIDQLQADVAGLMNIASSTISVLNAQEVRLANLESLMASSALAISTSTPGFLASVIDAVENTIFALLRTREVHTDKLCVEDVCVTREKFLEIVSGGPSATDDASDEEEADEEPEGAETIDESVPEEPAETATSTEDVVDNGADSTATSTPVVEESDMPDEEPAEEPSSEELTEEPPAPQEVQQPDSEPVPTEPAQEPAS